MALAVVANLLLSALEGMVDQTSARPYIVIEKLKRRVRIMLSGHLVLESLNALRLIEGRYAPVLYLPRADALKGALVPGKRRTHCPHKGVARYFDVKAKGYSARDAAWSYETPLPEVSAIAAHVAFYPHQVEIIEEEIDTEVIPPAERPAD